MRAFLGASCLFLLLLFPQPSNALLSQHSGFGCLGCHNLHDGSGGALLAEIDFEATCLSCHGPLGTATEVSIHDPKAHGVGNPGYVSCNECHNPHNNDRLNTNGGTNVKLVGIEIDYNSDPAVSVATPQVREETALGLGPLKEVVFETSPADWDRADGLGLCNACHGATHHTGEDCSGCHSHNDNFIGKTCTGCHDGLGAGALGVGSDSPHSETATGYTCVDCHTAHKAGDVEVPNNTVVGINYGSNGESGISLSDPVGTATTEAEICWNCHNQGGVSADWRNGGDFTGYSISTRDWTAASFDGPGVIPNRGVVSIHSANNVDVESPAPATPGIGVDATVRSSSVGNNWNSSNGSVNHSGLMENVGSIRCSYCHDLHELALAPNDTASGAPYLRGSWLSNPYPLERPPQAGDNWPGNTFGQGVNFPRLLSVDGTHTGSSQIGGFFIDQNSGYPTAGETAVTTSGLCILCHGSTVDSMDYYSNSSSATRLWIGSANGHANSTLGGSGPASGNNLFNANHGGPPYSMGTQNGVGVFNFGKANSEYMKQNGFYSPWRSSQPGKNNSTPPPKNSGWYGGTIGSNSVGTEYSSWYGNSVATMFGEPRAHNFSCSKCHTPHASGLPALLITNCLDRSIATWSGSVSSQAVGPGQTSGVSSSVQNNCHRKEGTYTTGWNRMAPGQ